MVIAPKEDSENDVPVWTSDDKISTLLDGTTLLPTDPVKVYTLCNGLISGVANEVSADLLAPYSGIYTVEDYHTLQNLVLNHIENLYATEAWTLEEYQSVCRARWIIRLRRERAVEGIQIIPPTVDFPSLIAGRLSPSEVFPNSIKDLISVAMEVLNKPIQEAVFLRMGFYDAVDLKRARLGFVIHIEKLTASDRLDAHAQELLLEIPWLQETKKSLQEYRVLIEEIRAKHIHRDKDDLHRLLSAGEQMGWIFQVSSRESELNP